MTYEAAPSPTAFAPPPTQFPRLAGRTFFQPMIAPPTRAELPPAMPATKPGATTIRTVERTVIERREAATHTDWEPVAVVR